MSAPDSGRLGGRTALVTGAASGIGRAIALLFAQEGAAVSLVDIDHTRGPDVAREITAAGGQACFFPANVSSQADCKRAVQYTVEMFGSLDILVNNAGIVRRATILDMEESEWDEIMAVNLKSVFLLSRLAIPIMIAGGGGVVVNVASGWGLVGGRQAAAYCASKGGVVQLTKAMALDHGEQGVRVNCICPGDTQTPMLKREAEQTSQPLDLFLRKAADRPLRRLGRPEDIAQAALYLASDAAAWVTGSALVVDGGGLAG